MRRAWGLRFSQRTQPGRLSCVKPLFSPARAPELFQLHSEHTQLSFGRCSSPEIARWLGRVVRPVPCCLLVGAERPEHCRPCQRLGTAPLLPPRWLSGSSVPVSALWLSRGEKSPTGQSHTNRNLEEFCDSKWLKNSS